VTFSLAQFGDFFTDMALNISVTQTSVATAPTPSSQPDNDVEVDSADAGGDGYVNTILKLSDRE